MLHTHLHDGSQNLSSVRRLSFQEFILQNGDLSLKDLLLLTQTLLNEENRRKKTIQINTHQSGWVQRKETQHDSCCTLCVTASFNSASDDSWANVSLVTSSSALASWAKALSTWWVQCEKEIHFKQVYETERKGGGNKSVSPEQWKFGSPLFVM